jgi:predicted GIY-YIG superfamily endonuclease
MKVRYKDCDIVIKDCYNSDWLKRFEVHVTCKGLSYVKRAQVSNMLWLFFTKSDKRFRKEIAETVECLIESSKRFVDDIEKVTSKYNGNV